MNIEDALSFTDEPKSTRPITPGPDVNDFPDPHRYATYLPFRAGNKFKTHATLRTCKGAIADKASASRRIRDGKSVYLREMKCDAWVYEYDFDLGKWVEITHIPKFSILEDDAWYTTKSKAKGALGPSASAVDAAIASIQSALPKEP